MAKAVIEDVLALSPLQQGLYSMATLGDPDDDNPYVIAMAADISGSLDAELLRRCAAAMFDRHPNLRASFLHGNLSKPVQVIPDRVEVPWRTVTSTTGQVAAIEAAERRRPFDVARGPLIRFLLIELPDAAWHLVIVAHHIVIDGWSLPLLIAELITLYDAAGDPAALPPAPRPYRDYIGWLAGRNADDGRGMWREHLAGVDGPTLLVPALTGAAPAPGLPQRTEVRLPAAPTAELAEAARSRGVTLNAVVQLAWATILSVLTDRDDVTFGVTVSGRPEQLSGVETMVGLFVNTIPLRVRLSPTEPAGTQCGGLQHRAAALREHSYLPHAELRALAGVGELFDTLLVYENFPAGAVVGADGFHANGATFRPTALESLSHFPVTIAAHLSAGELVVLVEVLDGALGELDPAELGRRVIAVAQRLIEGWDRPLREVSILLDEEDVIGSVRHPVRESARRSRRERGTDREGIADRIAAVAAEWPDAPAVSWDGGRFTYSELTAAAGRLAALLTERGIRAEDPVAIQLPRGPRYVVAMLAVLAAGGMIVPLDPTMPADRIADILAQTGDPMVVDDAIVSQAEAAKGAAGEAFRPVTVAPGRAAYAVFTSGTTGRPKGVVGTHRAVLAYGDDHIRHVLAPAAGRLGRRLRVAHAWSFTFDAAWQPLIALFDGHCVHIVGDDAQRDAEALVGIIRRAGIDMIDTTPSMFAQLHHAGLLTEVPLTVLAMGGEAVKSSTWQQIREICGATSMTAYNCYGPTETTVEALVAPLTEYARPSIGTPTDSTIALVLDSWLRPVPAGVAGELYLTGDQLTRGYLGRPGETAGRFVAAPGGQRMYRTGDVVRRNRDGGHEFLGRSDDQVKIRGFRVEPGEIAAVLAARPGVHGAHVTVRRGPRGPRLTAFAAVGTGDGAPTVPELRAGLAERLPRYLIPHRVVTVPALPLTGHGKIDENALTAADLHSDGSAAAAPETLTEAELVAALAELLGTENPDIDADFLELGLDSIVALSLVQLARRRGLPLRARLLRDCVTIRELAAALDAEARSGTETDTGGQPTGGPIPVLPNVHWLYGHGDPRRLAQTEALRLPDGVTAERLGAVVNSLVAGHEVLRTRLDRDTMTLVAHENPGPEVAEVHITGELVEAVAEHTRRGVESLDPQRGRLLAATWLRPPAGPGVLLLTAHVLAMDPASWRIALGELDAGWHAVAAGRDPAPPREHTSYRQWSQRLRQRAAALDTVDFWSGQLAGDDPAIGARRLDPDTDTAADVSITFSATSAEVTARLLSGATPATDLLAVAAARTVTAWRQRRGQPTPTPLLALETHGRADATLGGDVDTGDTVGLLSAIYPVRVDPGARGVAIDPATGVDYGLLRYLRDDTAAALRAHPEPQVLLNFLGRIHASAAGASPSLLPDRALLAGVSGLPEPNLAVRHEITLAAAIVDGADGPVLVTQWRTLPSILTAEDVTALQSLWQNALSEVLA